MSNLTREHVHHLHGRVQHLQKRAAQVREKFEGMTEKFVRTLEVTAGAIAGGVIQGKAGPEGAHVMGVPVDLGAGLALNLAGYFDLAGKHSGHLNNLGDGLLGAYASQVGFSIGKTWKDTGHLSLLPSHKAPALAPPSAPGTTTSGTISPEMMNDIIARVRQGGQQAA